MKSNTSIISLQLIINNKLLKPLKIYYENVVYKILPLKISQETGDTKKVSRTEPTQGKRKKKKKNKKQKTKTKTHSLNGSGVGRNFWNLLSFAIKLNPKTHKAFNPQLPPCSTPYPNRASALTPLLSLSHFTKQWHQPTLSPPPLFSALPNRYPTSAYHFLGVYQET